MSWLQAGTATNTLQGASASGEMLHQQIYREGTAIDVGGKKLLLPWRRAKKKFKNPRNSNHASSILKQEKR